MYLLITFISIPLVLAVKRECPGGQFQCSNDQTCCQLLDQTYACCPLPDAVCCDDHIHCCPENTKCSAGMCVQSANSSHGAFALTQRISNCPDKQSICPDKTTCCKNAVDKYSCCPLENAVCCNDGRHCCPSGTVCNLLEERCDGDGYVAQIYDSNKQSKKNKFVTLKAKEAVSSVICPGSTFQCPNGYTCCKMPSGNWGCCPFLDASCCRDGLHCCPAHMTCDPSSQFCRQGLRNITSLRQLPAEMIVGKNICPDETPCEDLQTCCRMKSGFGCCLYENATCCSDLLHCCPANEECHVESGKCVPKNEISLKFNYSENEI